MDIESRSWICNYLNKKEIIDKNEFMILSRFGTWVAENHPQVMGAYWSYLDKLMSRFDKIESYENARKIFRPWVDNTVKFIKSSQLNKAYLSFCMIVISLTEKYNKTYDLFTKVELEVYLKIKNSILDYNYFY